MASVFKSQGASKYAITWTDENGRRRKRTAFTDKAASQRLANELENQKALRRAGLIDPKAEAHRNHEARPLTEHVDDFARSLSAKGATARHANSAAYRVRRLLELSKARRISDLSLSKTLDALAVVREEGASAGTVGNYTASIRQFSRWLWRDGRAREYLLVHLGNTTHEADRRRRALSHEEAARLVGAAARGPVVRGMTGPDRAMLYAVALGTGLRSKELASLTPESFDLDSPRPTARVLACYSKNRKQAVQPLAHGLADRLRSWLASRPPGEPVFEGMPAKTAAMIRVDLKAAGIEPETASGTIDFHSCRVTYISNLVASGASVKTCQVLARHANPSLTIGVYAKASLHDLAGAVEALPSLNPEPDRSNASTLKAAGTDDRLIRPTATESATAPLRVVTQVEDRKGGCADDAAFVYNTAMLDDKIPRKPAPARTRPPVQAAAVDSPARSAEPAR